MHTLKHSGFTLIELMIVIAIIAILASIAYPSYQDSVRKSRRADGKIALTRAAALQEKIYMDQNSYTSDITKVGGGASPDGYYTITVTGQDGCKTTVSGIDYYSCFTMTATAIGAQAGDTACTPLTLSNTGDTGTTSACW